MLFGKPAYLSKKPEKALPALDAIQSQQELAALLLQPTLPQVKDAVMQRLTPEMLRKLDCSFDYSRVEKRYREQAKKMLQTRYAAELEKRGTAEEIESFLAENKKLFGVYMDLPAWKKKAETLRLQAAQTANHARAAALRGDEERLAFLSEKDALPEDKAAVYRRLSEPARSRFLAEAADKTRYNGPSLPGWLLSQGVLEQESPAVCDAALLAHPRVQAADVLLRRASPEACAEHLAAYVNRYFGNPFWYKEDYAETAIRQLETKDSLLRAADAITVRKCPAKFALLSKAGLSDREIVLRCDADALPGDRAEAFAGALTMEDVEGFPPDVYTYLLLHDHRDEAFSDQALLHMGRRSEAFVAALIEYVFKRNNTLSDKLLFLLENDVCPALIRQQDGRQLTEERSIEREYYHDEYRYEIIPATYFHCPK